MTTMWNNKLEYTGSNYNFFPKCLLIQNCQQNDNKIFQFNTVKSIQNSIRTLITFFYTDYNLNNTVANTEIILSLSYFMR